MLQYPKKLKHEFKPVAGVEPALGVAPKVNLQTKSQKHKSLTLRDHGGTIQSYVKYEFEKFKLIKNSKNWYLNKHNTR